MQLWKQHLSISQTFLTFYATYLPCAGGVVNSFWDATMETAFVNIFQTFLTFYATYLPYAGGVVNSFWDASMETSFVNISNEPNNL